MKKFYQCLFIVLLTVGTNISLAQGGNELAATLKDRTAQVLQNTKVSLNQASVKELIKVKGIKPNNAKALVRYRKKHGDFKSVEEVAFVKGFKRMKPQTLKQIEDQLVL